MRYKVWMTRALTLLLAAFTIPATLAAQDDNTAGEFGDLIEVSEVLLDVLVTDRDGKVVLGLEEEDFIVEETEKNVPVTGVSFYSNRFELRDGQVGKIQQPAPNEVLADRYFILFFHDQRRNVVEQNRLLRQQFEASRHSQRWVQEEMLPGDWVAVVSYDVKLKIHQDFTQDRSQLVRAIKQAAKGTDPKNTWESRRPEVPEGQPTLMTYLPEGKDLRKATTRIYDAMQLLAESTRDILGRKNLLLFSFGFGEVERIAGGNFITEGDERFYPGLEQSLNDNNVAVYPIDLTPSEFEHIQSHFLTQLAQDTGGYYYENFVSFSVPIQKIADESNGYYLLSYQTEHPAGESGYRQVEVKTKNPEFKVRTRRGYLYGS